MRPIDATRHFGCGKIWLGGVALALMFAAPASADNPIWKIEEDWELVVNEPDAVTYSPQVTLFTAPTASDDVYFQLQMNYFADEDFSGGGFHVAAVQNEQILDEARSNTRRAIQVYGDRIRWTSVMAAFDDQLFYAVSDGHSDDWGSFGGPDYLVQMPASGVNDLSEYTPQKSVANVDIGFGANRVDSLKLLRVRVFYASGDSQTYSVQE